ncbi:hypothetical protein J7J00_25725 [Bacillus sp. ISL-4]|uniref:hypothetical protein n=1 Tax=Bacillus sp. ISL-4 TaxID=2819125 RepID=UPI001BEB2132|nr:hypothetical protein [Bacillus sp. ISL-4]MBT2668807.1 hypothetical protein [Bacillus sp. ISL-4]MBT2673227.1 hypothetical protein [Streptomyces sp. ISL-14]
MAFEEDEAGGFNEMALGIARDIECQWVLFLVNTYSLKNLRPLFYRVVRAIKREIKGNYLFK